MSSREITAQAGLEEARTLLREYPAIDLHCDTIAYSLAGDSLFELDGPQATPPRLVRGGFGEVVYAFWIPAHLGPVRGWERVEAMMHRLRDTRDEARARANGDDGVPVRFRPALEDARVLCDHPERVDQLREWGASYVTLTWNTGNRWATSCEDSRNPDVGLTAEGRGLVAALDDAGIPTDVSHLSDRAALDVLAAATRTPLASHSSARALCPHPRNVSDSLARAIADRGGIIGVNLYRHFLAIAAQDADIEAVISHVEHLWNVAGENAVAFGSDFDGIPAAPIGLEGSDRFPYLVASLLRRGHPADRVIRFVRTNAERVLPASDPETLA